MPEIEFTNVGPDAMTGTIDGTQRTLETGEGAKFPTVCELVQFVNANQGGVYETREGLVDEVNKLAADEGCPDRVQGRPIVVTTGAGEAALPAGGDTPATEGAPSGEAAGSVDVEHGDASDPADVRSPAEVVHDPVNPRPEAEVVDQLVAEGASPDDAAQEGERARRGDPPVGEPRSWNPPEQSSVPTTGGDPVDLFSGALTLSIIDLDVPTPFLPLQFVRRYRSGAPYYGPWGFNWDHSWNIYLRELSSGNLARGAGTLHEDEFTWIGAAFEPPRGVFELLERDPVAPARYVNRLPGGVLQVFERPQGWSNAERIPLILIEDRAGNRISLTYDAQDRLARVRDADGRGFDLAYGDCGMLEAVTDHAGRQVRYWHATDVEHLVKVFSPATADAPDGLVTQYEYDAQADHPVSRNNIIRVVNHDQLTTVENVYEHDPSSWAFNRVTEQYLGGFVYRFEYEPIQWLPADPLFVNEPVRQTAEHRPDGSLWTYTYNYRGDLLDMRHRLNRDGSYRIVVHGWEYDEQGNMSVEIGPDGGRREHTYDAANADPRMRGNRIRAELRAAPGFPSPSRIVFRAQYDPVYQAVRMVVAESGTVTRYLYDFDSSPGPGVIGNLERIRWPDATLPDGTVQTAETTFESNARGQTTAITSPEGTRNEQAYEPAGSTRAGFLRELRRDVGGSNEVTVLQHDARGFLSKRTEPGGVERMYSFNDLGLVEREVLPDLGAGTDELRFSYDANLRVRRIEYPRGAFDDGVTSDAFLVDSFRSTPLGFVATLERGSNTGRPRRTEVCANFQGLPERITDAMSALEQRKYDERGRLLSVVRAAGTPVAAEERFTYDLAGRLTRTESQGGRVTQHAYDGFGRLVRTLLPNGSTVRLAYGPMDLLSSRQLDGDPGDGTPPRPLERTDFEYDERGRQIRLTVQAFAGNPAAAVPLSEERWHDRDGRCIQRVGLRGATWTYGYDGADRATVVVNPVGDRMELTYQDTMVRRVTAASTEPGGGVRRRWVEYEHDARRRLIRTVTSTGGDRRAAWDARDYQVATMDAVGVVETRRWGLLGDLESHVIDAGGLALAYDHIRDALGREIGFTDPTGETTALRRDELGRPRELVLADGSMFIREFAPGTDDLTRYSTPGGGILQLTYDGGGRLTSLQATPAAGRAATPPHAFRYDGTNRLVRATAGASVVERRFDSLGRLVEEDCEGRTFSRTYDDLAGTIRLQYPDGRVDEYLLDPIARSTRITLAQQGASAVAPNGGVAGTVLARVAYLGPNEIAQVVRGNGIETEYRRDDDRRVIRLEHSDPVTGSLEAARYRYDRMMRRRVAQLSGPPTVDRHHEFDARGRLVRWQQGFGLPTLADEDTQAAQEGDILTIAAAAGLAALSEEYDLDGSDTRETTTRTQGAAPSATPYGRAPTHQIVSIGATALTYGPDGARETDAGRRIEYDALGRTTRVSNATTNADLARFEYDALGRWAGGFSAGAAVRRFHLGDRCLVEEDASGNVTVQRVFHPSIIPPLIETRAAGPLHLHSDAIGSVLLVTDGSGLPVERYRYEPFGEPGIFDPTGTIVRAAGALGGGPWFAGMPYLQDTGLYFTPVRLYDPAAGVFLSRDPLLHATSPSAYAYALHDPVNLLDPLGLTPAADVPQQATDEHLEWSDLDAPAGDPEATSPDEPENTEPSPWTQAAAATMSSAAPITEWALWNPGVGLTRAEELAIASRRGFAFDRLAGNNLGRTFPLADYVTDTAVGQTKSVKSTNLRYVRQVTRRAAQDAAQAIRRNPALFTGRVAEARIVLPTGTSRQVADTARQALTSARGTMPNARVVVTRGLPGGVGVAGKVLGVAGAGLAAYGLYQDIQRGDIASGIGNGTSLAASALTVGGALAGSTAVAAAGAVTGAFALGYGVGTLINEYLIPEDAQMAIGEAIFDAFEFLGFDPLSW